MKKILTKGKVGCLGQAIGIARVIKTDKDFSRFKPGEILVTRSTNPAWTPLIGIAKAVVTDIGSSLCHAAIVAREYDIPCIVATKNGIKVIKDGEKIEVDADKGIVRSYSTKSA
jgi:phosphoenolpyruvate synthase/pyruvate phosphate dikinase